MILVAGGSGRLGSRVVELLAAAGRPVRILTRDPSLAGRPGTEVAIGDLRDRAAVARAMAGVTTVVSAAHGLLGGRSAGPVEVDRDGNATLVELAQDAGAGHFVLVSIHGASPDHPLELFRMKHAAEEAVRGGKLAWTIVRPTAFTELWVELLGDPIRRSGRALVFGRGENAVNLVSVEDVARLVARAVTDPALRGQEIDIGSPDDLPLQAVVGAIRRVTGIAGRTRHVPRPVLRGLAAGLGPVQPVLARQARMALAMDTTDMRFHGAPAAQALRPLDAVVRAWAERA
jgi:uncharacterized protein YbjT (DUF2867 family)